MKFKGQPFIQDIVKYLALAMAEGDVLPVNRASLTYLSNDMVTIHSISDSLNFIDGCQQKALVIDREMKNIDLGGAYDSLYNVIYICDRDKEYLAHEMTHAALQLNFENDCLPYALSNTEAKKDFSLAITKIFEHIAIKMGVQSIDSVDNSLQDFYDNPQKIGHSMGLSQDEICLFSNLLTPTLSNAYLEDYHDAEFIARAASAYLGAVNRNVLDQYLEPLFEPWYQYVHLNVQNIYHYHIDVCSNNDIFHEKVQFQYCILTGELN